LRDECMRWVDDLYMIMSINHIWRCCERVSVPGWFCGNVEGDSLGGVFAYGWKNMFMLRFSGYIAHIIERNRSLKGWWWFCKLVELVYCLEVDL